MNCHNYTVQGRRHCAYVHGDVQDVSKASLKAIRYVFVRGVAECSGLLRRDAVLTGK